MGAPEEPPARSLQIRLKAGVSDPSLRAAHNATLTIPATVGRKALSKLLQTLLSLSEPLPFHFLISEEPLRTTLDKFLLRRNRTAEQTLDVVYYLPLPEPRANQSRHASPEWLSSVCAASESLVVAGSYTGAPSVLAGDALVAHDAHAADAHAAAVKAVAWLPDASHFVTASLDRTARVWRHDAAGACAAPVAELRTDDTEHAAALCSVSSGAGACALGGDDGSVWLLPHVADAPAAPGKRARLQALPATRLAELPAALPVTGVAWRGDELVTAGWDALARVWDVEACTATLAIPCGGKAVTGLAAADRLLVSGVDGGVRLVDTRDGKGVVAACGRRGAHKGVVGGVAWMDDGVAVSGGYDGSLRFWDVRNFMAPSRVVEEVHGGGRCLAVDAVRRDGGKGWTVFSAGEDGKVASYFL